MKHINHYSHGMVVLVLDPFQGLGKQDRRFGPPNIVSFSEIYVYIYIYVPMARLGLPNVFNFSDIYLYIFIFLSILLYKAMFGSWISKQGK